VRIARVCVLPGRGLGGGVDAIEETIAETVYG
jgi:hypothetical protein